MEEDEDRDDTPKKAQAVAAPALAGLTSIIAASPLLSRAASEDAEREKEATKRKVIRIPDDDTVIVPLHGDSDEDINPDRYANPSLVVVQKLDEPSPEKIKKPSSRKTSSKKKVPPEPTSSKQKLVTPALAGLATVIAATPILSDPRTQGELTDSEIESNHGDSEEHSKSASDHGSNGRDSATGEVNIPSKSIELKEDKTKPFPETKIKEKLLEVEKTIENETIAEPSKDQLLANSKKTEQYPQRDNYPTPPKTPENPTRSKTTKPSESSKVATPALAGLTTLIAASPILAVTSDDEEEELEEKNIQEVHARRIIRIPNQEGVIVPLHGDSDEELNPERYSNPSLVGVQRVDETVAKPSRTLKEDKVETKSPAAKLVTPALAGLTSLVASSPLLAATSEVKVSNDGSMEGENSESANDEATKPKERKVIKMPNNEGVIVPLHGDSDEEIHPDRYHDPSNVAVEHISGPVLADLKPLSGHQDEKEKKKGLKALSFKKAKEQASKVATPLLAGMTTLLAASPILVVSPKEEEAESVVNEDVQEEKQEDTKDIVVRKCIRTPNAEGVIIPLHGDSDEELHPGRYEDPSMVTFQGINAPAETDVIPSRPPKTHREKRKRPRSLNLKKVTSIAVEQATKVVTPIISGVSQILTSSPFVSTPSLSTAGSEVHTDDLFKNTVEETHSVTEDVGENGIKCIKLSSTGGVIVPLHGDSDEELHPERYEDPSKVFVRRIDTPKIENESGPSAEEAQHDGQWPIGQAGKRVTPLLAGMTSLLAASPMLAVPPDEENNLNEKLDEESKVSAVTKKDEKVDETTPTSPRDAAAHAQSIPESPSKIAKAAPSTKNTWVPPDKTTKVATPFLAGITTVLVAPPAALTGAKKTGVTESQHKPLELDNNDEAKEELEERKFIKIVNQEAVIVPLHGDSDEELHPDRYEDPSLQGVHSIVGSIVEEGIPQPRPHRRKNKPNQPSTTNDNDPEPQVSGNVHLERDHDYEPINPKDPTSQPAVALEQSKPNVQFDLSHEETSAVEAEVTKKQEETKQQEPPNAQEPKQKEQPEPSQPPKLVTPSLAGLTALLAASPVLSSTASPEQIEPQEEEKKDEIVERKFIRIPNESAVIIPLHGDSDEEIHPERYLDPSLQGVQKIDGPVVEILKPPPSQPPAQLQSVPHLQKPNLSELPAQPILSRQPPPPPPVSPSLDDDNQSVYEPIQKPEDIAMEAGQTTKTFQDRFKAGAGELRDKFRNISVPKISLPDRPHIKFPDHKNFKLPERPQFLKEKPQFLKERPQFLKEKPKFLTERPQFLKEKPKFLTEKPKFLKERPKFHLPERPQFKVPEKFKFERAKKADRPKVRKPNPSSLRRPLRDAITISSQSGSSHNLFEALKAKTYPRFLSKKKRDRERAAQLRAQTSLETESSLPSSPPDRRKVYPEKFRDIRFADEEPSYNEQKMEIQSDEDSGRHPVVFQDNYLRPSPYTEQEREERMKAKIDSSSDLMDSDKEQVSSGGSSMKHRVGVLEEIDSDEFFLRQKGLSREDVDVSRYLSKEIRDAFRSPKNTLALIGSPGSYEDYDDDDMDIDVEYIEDQTPRPPERRRSVKSNRSRDSDLNTFPARPLRMKQSGSESGSREIFEKVKKPPRKFPTKSDRRQGSVRSLDRSSRHSETLNETPRPPSRQKSSRSLTRSRPESETDVHGGSVRIEEARDASLTPVRPLRLSQSRGASIDERTSRGADSLPQDYGEYDRDEDEIDEDEDEIEVEEDYEQEITDPIAREHIQVFHTVQIEPTVLAKSSAVDDEEVPGYAVVRKPKPPRPPPPPKSRKEQLQSQLQSIKSQGINFFQTFPRRAMKSLNKPRLPVRPFRNYSTIGPVRPPRRNRVFREPVYVEGDPSGEQEPDGTESGVKELEDVRMENEEHRDLQSGEVLERMKGRPLPPPPRPPRKSKDDDSLSSFDNRFEVEVEEPISEVASVPDVISISEDIIVQSPRIYDLNSSAVVPTEDQPIQVSEVHAHPTIESSQQTSFEISDVNVSIQTDPLPENYIVEAEPVDTLSRSSIPTSTQSSQTETEKPSRKPDECDSRLQDRRRLFDPRVVEESEEAEEEGTPPPLPPRKIVQPLPELPPVQVSFPDKLHLTQLDVDKLNVNELQANIIKVSDIDSVTMQISEISSGTGNLILNNIELPADFIKNLVAQIPIPEPTPKIEEPVKASTPQPHLKRMFTPPPPIVVQHSPQSASEAPSPPVQQASTTEHLPKPKTPRTRRKSPMRLLDDSEDELASVIFVRERKERQRVEQEEALSAEPKIQKDIDKNVTKAEESSDISPTTSSAIPKSSSSPEPSTSTATAEDPSSLELMKQLLSIWYKNLVRGTTSFVGGINSIFPENEKRRDSQMAALLLVIIIATLILLGLGADHQVHHHHWDYLNPPR